MNVNMGLLASVILVMATSAYSQRQDTGFREVQDMIAFSSDRDERPADVLLVDGRGDVLMRVTNHERYCQMLWMARERIRRFQAASFISPSMNGTPSMTWVMSL